MEVKGERLRERERGVEGKDRDGEEQGSQGRQEGGKREEGERRDTGVFLTHELLIVGLE